MNYLLDTHAIIWALSDRGKLSNSVLDIMSDENNLIYASSISFWEISLKFSIGKLKINGILPNELPELILEQGFDTISLTPEESSSSYKLTLYDHKDPFDRMLIWQAINRNLILVTKDDNLQQYKIDGLKTLW